MFRQILRPPHSSSLNSIYQKSSIQFYQFCSYRSSFPYRGLHKERQPFKKATENKRVEKTIHQDFNSPWFSELGIVLEKALADPNLLNNYNYESVKPVLDKLWSIYLAQKKRIDKQVRFNSALKSNLNENIDHNIFLSNIQFRSPKNILHTFDNIISQFSRLFQSNIDKITKHPGYFTTILKTLVKFESTYKNETLWILVDEITAKLIANQNPAQTEINYIISLLKSLSARNYYLQCKASEINSAHQELLHIQDLESKVYAYIVENNNLMKITQYISIMTHFQRTRDPLLDKVRIQAEKSLDGSNDFSDIAWCINKVVKFRYINVYNRIFIKMQKVLLESAKASKLSTKSICVALWAFTYQKQVTISPGEFQSLWNNLMYNYYSNEIVNDFNIFDVSTLMASLIRGNFTTNERFKVLQIFALNAIQKLEETQEESKYNNDRETEQNRLMDNYDVEELNDNENENEQVQEYVPSKKLAPTLAASSCIIILGNLAQREVVESLNYELIESLYRFIIQNDKKIFFYNYSNLICSSALLVKKLSDKQHDEPICQKLRMEALKVKETKSNQFFEQIKDAKVVDIVKVFRSLASFGVNLREYDLLSKALISNVNKIPYYNQLMVLSGIADLKSTNSLIDTDTLEETFINAILPAIKNLSFNSYLGTVQNSKNLSPLKHIKTLGVELDNYFNMHLRSMDVKSICSVLFFLRFLLVGQNMNAHKLAAPIIQPKLQDFTDNELFQITVTYFNRNYEDLEFLNKIQFSVLKKLNLWLSLPEIPETVNLLQYSIMFNDFAKYNIEDKRLITQFETFFMRCIRRLTLIDISRLINVITLYLSTNVELITALLEKCEAELKQVEGKQSLLEMTPSSLIMNFNQGIFTVDLEYKDTINLANYPNILSTYEQIMSNIDKIRYVSSVSSKFQGHIAEELNLMKYKFKVEHPVAIYIVDIFMEPNIIIEADGPLHYQGNTREMCWKYKKRQRQLQKLGYKVVIFHHHEWEQVEGSVQQRFKFISDKIGFSP